MSQVRENLTALTGIVTAGRPHPTLPGYDEVTIEVTAASPVEGVADLLAPLPGTSLAVAVRHDLVGDVRSGAGIRLRASRGSSGNIIAEPHPSPADFEVTE